ncbi:hypothetical protein QI188_11620 [Staphylococcus saprophyticus]|nr:hypothetical protein [Staphylococcus saprophyticus]
MSIKMRITEYQHADAVTGGLDYENEIEMDAWEGILQEMEGKEREIKERD